MYQFIFLDLDDTILDFHKAEAIAVGKTFATLGIAPTEDLICRYSQVNKLHWEMLERREITREQVLVGRFAYLFRERGIDTDPALCKQTYEHFLSMGHYFVPGAEALLAYLSPKYKLYLASNGTASVQAGRLQSAGILPYFADVFISEELGANKPAKEFFDRAFSRIPGFDPKKAIIIGDSLTSDILGGRNAGIATCWYNPKGLAPRKDIPADFEIRSLEAIRDIL